MRAALALTAVLVLLPAAARAAPDDVVLPAHADPRDAGGSPLDVRAVAFGQEQMRLLLTVRTQAAWRFRDLGPGRTLCLLLGSSGRLCVGSRGELRFRARPGAPSHRVAGASVRPAGRTLRVSVLPSALGLRLGSLRWAVESRWTDAAGCAAACVDRVPDDGAVSDPGAFRTRVRAFAAPPCFGAAAFAQRPCRNPSLRRLVYPRPDSAYIWPNSACRPMRRAGAAFDPCDFGVTGARRRGTVALLGDSHAIHWRAALKVVAQVKRWRGISITRPGCPFSTQIPRSPSLGPGACLAQHAATLAWLRAHPGVHTVFVSDWAEPPGGPQGGIGGYGGGPGAFGAMLDALPRSVRHIFVLRDIPATTLSSTVCVHRRLRTGRPAGDACASPRAAVLTPDPGTAAAAARRPRTRVIDLTRLFCGPARCPPVIGGVYIHKDDNHMNAVFAATLGPYVLRAL